MKLLFDQNISFRLVKLLSDFYPEAKQVRELNLENSSDIEIFDYAKKNGYSIVTFDADFCDLNAFRGAPPKIIWLRVGNTTTKKLKELLIEKFELISDFLIDNEYGYIEIND